ncbi:DUF6240 domain-containing protein [[Clostridium] fimetarium]|uniref:Flagellar hook-length control protein FliK n=1 Tax=[Clostridium] fimetarium TaxID=99656 RepID=A0A1I0QSE6_9FIRM|nr:DUF6240 domain-containing protein [[Clostridium] fimetarium]SEW30285.1 hypothetical protein SAMN05421659_10940 [[Clostridium] fimetarium]
MNISAVNLNSSEDTLKSNSINIKSNTSKADSKGVDKLFENANVATAEKTRSTQVDSKGLAALMDEGSCVTDELKNSAEAAKSSLKALFSKMSVADCVQMDEEGFNLNEMSPDKIVTVVDRIKIMLATYCEDYQVTDENIDISKIKQVVGSTAMANQVEAKLKSADLPNTKENIDEIANATKQAEEIKPLSEGAKRYLVSNELEPSIQNIYKAEHASVNTSMQAAGYQSTSPTVSNDEWSQLKPQVEAVIQKAGLNVDEQNISNAKSFIENNIPVTQKNLVYKNQLDNLDLTKMDSEDSKGKVLDKIIGNMALGNSASATLLTDVKSIVQMVSEAIKTVNSADVDETATVTNQGKQFTIENLRIAQGVTLPIAQSQIENQVDNQIQNQVESQSEKLTKELVQASPKELVQASVINQDAQAITNYRQLEEIRILMTAEAGLSLANQGFNLDTTPIVDLVEQLKAMELQLYGDDASEVLEVKKAINEIKKSPDVMISSVMAERSANESITIADFSQMGSNLGQRFKQAGQTYETVGTQVRNDLGDSINKAVEASTNSILAELKLEDTKTNRDAVRILGYNGMDMTIENINTVKDIYSTLNNLIENMKPETVLAMIKDNINPMNSDINDVNQYLIQQNEGANSTDKFSKFLYKLDKTDGITAQEREQFIGIYKMMNIFKKDAGKAVGTLVKQNSDITMSNLMTAYNSSKVAGIDTSIDDTTGMAEVEGIVNYYNSMFSETAECITPKSLKTVNDEKSIATRSVENFCEQINQSYDSNLEGEYYDNYLKDMNKITDVEDSVIRQLTDNNLPVSINNIMAALNIMTPNYFQKYFNLEVEKTDGEENEKGRTIEGGDNFEGFIDKLGSESEINLAYQQMADEVAETTIKAMDSSENQAYSDIEELRMRGKEIGLIQNLAQKHDYKIPYVIDGEVGTINLQIVEDKNDKGRIAIKLRTKDLGNVSVEGKLSAESASIFAVTDGDEKVLSDRINKVTSNIAKEFKMESIGVYIGKSNEIPAVSYKTEGSEISMKTLYSFAKTLIVGLINSKE